jgi:putative transposase
MTRIVEPNDDANQVPGTVRLDIDEICRLAAREMLAIALETERRAFLEAHAGELDEAGHRLVVGNGHAPERTLLTGAGAVEVAAPRVADHRDEPERFRSALLPPYARRSPKVAEVLPILYLRGLSSGDFAPALSSFFGTEAGLSSSTIVRLSSAWQAEHARWSGRDLSARDYVYWWVDGIHFRIRLEEDRLCALVIVGVRLDGAKELVAVADGYRESAESWAALLRDLRDRGLGAPVLATGDGALGFWAALRDVFPSTREQRCWVHKSANVIDALPKRLADQGRAGLAAIWSAPTRAAALDAAAQFGIDFAEYPRAVAKVNDDLDALLAFYDFPADHWIHLRTTNPIESTFSTVRLRTRVTKGAGSREAALAMAFKLIEAAQGRWRKISSPQLVALVRAGAHFVDGKLPERTKEATQQPAEQEDAAA